MILSPEIDPLQTSGGPAISLHWAVASYYAFRDAGIDLVLASFEGGAPFMDPAGGDSTTAEVTRFKQDPLALEEFSDILRFDQTCIDDFDSALCVGRPDGIWPTGDARGAGNLVAGLLQAGKPVAMTPSRTELAPKGLAGSLILIGAHGKSPASIAYALLGVARQSNIISDGGGR